MTRDGKRKKGREFFFTANERKIRGLIHLLHGEILIQIINWIEEEESNVRLLFRNFERIEKKKRKEVLRFQFRIESREREREN